uniref:Uncharacterized protein n=1 Tax=Branchiostoma floridae TaxID=7739 RepID=C3YZ56_BRAFL|eukprot:XP_002598552.1 hypothetical protein BRAFLDRAFT_66943 [Branchiostoma floridae]
MCEPPHWCAVFKVHLVEDATARRLRNKQQLGFPRRESFKPGRLPCLLQNIDEPAWERQGWKARVYNGCKMVLKVIEACIETWSPCGRSCSGFGTSSCSGNGCSRYRRSRDFRSDVD